MLAQIKFAIQDISEHTGRFLISFIQILVSLLLIAYAVTSIAGLKELNNNTRIIDNIENIYIMTDVTDDDYFDNTILAGECHAELAEYYSFLKESKDFDTYTLYTDYAVLDSEEREIIYADDGFLSTYQLSDAGGNTLEGIFGGDYVNTTPIIMGSVFQNWYNIGDTVEVNSEELTVAAFLEADSYYMNLSWSKDPISLD